MRRNLPLGWLPILALACSTDTGPGHGGWIGPAYDVGDGAVRNDGGDPGGTGVGDAGHLATPSLERELDAGGFCEALRVRLTRLSPEMLIVLDRSGSPRGDAVDGWMPSVRTLNALTGALEREIRFGLMTFPGNIDTPVDAGDDRARECAAGRLDAPIALHNAAVIEQRLADTEPAGRRPTAATLQGVLNVLQPSNVDDPDAVIVPKYVLLVMRGAPNCMRGEDDSVGAVDATVAAIDALAKAGIPTYVAGYGSGTNAELSAALDRMAVAGDTGDRVHHRIEDEASLLRELEDVAGAATNCDFLLDIKLTRVDYAYVELDGQQLSHAQPNGFVIGPDGRTITLQGAACSKLRDGQDHALSVALSCTVVP